MFSHTLVERFILFEILGFAQYLYVFIFYSDSCFGIWVIRVWTMEEGNEMIMIVVKENCLIKYNSMRICNNIYT